MNMSCISCAKPYTLFRKEKGCPGCGFSYCSKCIDNKIFLKKLNSEVKVCNKCKKSANADDTKRFEPPDAYFKRIGALSADSQPSSNANTSTVENEIEKRLQNLKADKIIAAKGTSDEEIAKRLQNIKGNQPSTSDAELHLRLANLRGIPYVENKPVICVPDLRTEQEQADDLMKHYMEQTNIDERYKDGFEKQIKDIETRVQNLKGDAGNASRLEPKSSDVNDDQSDIEDEHTAIKKIIERVKAEANFEGDISPPIIDELPFCEICNEDARMRCLGCRYLFCKSCFKEHKDDDDECNRYEPYTPPKVT